jgi:hypothetical protein
MWMSRACLAVAAVAMMLGAGGCQKTMRDVLTLQNAGDAPVSEQEIAVPVKGTYYLYSSADPKAERFRRELKKGDLIGFRVRGNRVWATAAGTIVELEDYAEGASYVWRLEEKKE